MVFVPFPFTDRNSSKRRPALVLSSSNSNQKAGHTVLTIIISAGQSSLSGDSLIKDLDAAGLRAECVLRLKLFTLDHRLNICKTDCLATGGQKNASGMEGHASNLTCIGVLI